MNATQRLHLCHHRKCKTVVYFNAFNDMGYRVVSASGMPLRHCPNRECLAPLTESSIVIGAPPDIIEHNLQKVLFSD